jgi:rhodanese-related sulfurtransferase
MTPLSPAEVHARLGDLHLYDTRPAALIAAWSLPGARQFTLEQAQAGEVPDSPKDAPLCLVCERGHISELAGLYLEQAGFRAVHNLAGGLRAWRAAFPEMKGRTED